MTTADGLLSAGRVGRPHGLDGSFHVTRPRERLLAGITSLIVDGETCEVVRRAGTEARPILRLGGHEGRAAAEALRGKELWVPRAEAPRLGDDEWLAEDLEGLAVVDGATAVGTVRRLLAYPSCELLEVVRDGRPELLVPLIGDAVRTVDLEARRIDVDLAFLGEHA